MQVWVRQTLSFRQAIEKKIETEEGLVRFPVPGWMWDLELGRDMYDQRMRHIRRIDELGFDGIIFTEQHYVTVCPSPNLLVAAATQVTEQAKLVLMGNCLPLHNPVRLAEELAMLDNLSRGRIVAGFLRGTASSHYAFNVPGTEVRSRFAEAYDLVVRAWTDENPFEWHGDHYDYSVVSIVPRPYQQPHPPVWTVAGSAESLEWAASKRVGLIAQGTIQGANETLDYYQNYAERECGWSPTAASRALNRDMYIAPTMAGIRDRFEDVIVPLYMQTHEYEMPNQPIPRIAELRREEYSPRSYAYRTVQGRGAVGDRARRSPEQVAADGDWLVGDPDSITEQILRQCQACNADTMIVRPEMGTLALNGEVIDQLDLFARTVLPVLHKAQSKQSA
ncbi:MAG: flavin-dependent oxidoreductase [Chloroflexi bacterium]|nr:flavin-dependent oxidoreductase [Chloroflexota bacterium]